MSFPPFSPPNSNRNILSHPLVSLIHCVYESRSESPKTRVYDLFQRCRFNLPFPPFPFPNCVLYPRIQPLCFVCYPPFTIMIRFATRKTNSAKWKFSSSRAPEIQIRLVANLIVQTNQGFRNCNTIAFPQSIPFADSPEATPCTRRTYGAPVLDLLRRQATQPCNTQ